MYRIILLLSTLTASLVMTGCTSTLFYKDTTDQQIAKINQGDLKNAMSNDSSSDVLHNLQYGTLKRIAAEYKESNNYYSKAQTYIQAWASSWKNTTSGKLTSNMLSLLTSDNVNAYQVKDFEKSFLATLYAMNQLGLNNFADARVEITQMYETEEAIENYNFALYNATRRKTQSSIQDANANKLYLAIKRKYNFQDINSPAVLALKNSYQNAFGHYLAGFVFQALNEPSLSRPGYVKAGQLNPTNPLIQRSINNLDHGVKPKAKQTDLLIVQMVGHAPQIQSVQAMLQLPTSDNQNNPCMTNLTLFFPRLIYDKDNRPTYKYRLDGKLTSPLPLVNVNLMAARAMHDDIPHILLRNLTANLRSYLIARQACMQGGNAAVAMQLGSLGLNLFLNRADERAWVLLPAYININRQTLSYGQHKLMINVNGTEHSFTFNLNQPYQVFAFRVFNNQVFFQPQLSMEST